MSNNKRQVNFNIPWKKSLKFRLTILFASVSVFTGIVMIFFLSHLYLGNVLQIYRIEFLIITITVTLVLFASVIINLFIIRKFVILPINKIYSGVTSYTPETGKAPIYPRQAAMRYGDELEALERVIIDMESRIFNSVEAERRASSVKNAFLANMGHELRTPLNSSINMIKEAIIANDDITKSKALQQAFASSNDLLSVLNTILEISNIESGSLILSNSPFLMGMVVLEINNLISLLCKAKGVLWEPRINVPGTLSLEGDKIRLMQVLAILLRNAVKYANEEQGRVLFIIDLESETKETVCIRFEVYDNGIGMTEKKLGELTQMFALNSDDIHYSSSEIMLSACSRIVKAMGSQIMVESKTDNYKSTSCFSFTLNLPKATMPAQPEEMDISKIDFSKKRVLIADDVRVNRTVLINMLSQTGMEIIEATDGKEAIDIFLVESENIDLILMDIMMPNMDGYEATQQIRASGLPKALTVPIIAVTTRSYKEDVDMAINSGMNYHLEKPVEPKTLLSVIRRFLG